MIPAAWIYGGLVGLRRAWLRRCPPVRLAVPVISVGNLTVGGTGKTEAVFLICRQLRELGRCPGILSRGYGRRSRTPILVVSDGSGPRVRVEEAGDEPYLLAGRLPGTVVVVGKDRIATGTKAVKELGCDVLVLDDGFARRDQIHRDLDILLMDAGDPWGGERMLPAGRLREPLSGLGEADLIILTRTDQHPTRGIIDRLAKLAPKKPVMLARHAPKALVSLGTGTRHEPECLARRRVLAVSGIARPQALAATLEALGAEVIHTVVFPDHYWYRDKDREYLRLQAEAWNAEIVTTAKDAVRLGWPQEWPVPAWILEVQFEIVNPGEGLSPWIKRI